MKFKKFFAALASAAVAASLCVSPAFAATIQFENGDKATLTDETYEYLKLFDVTADGNKYAYSISAENEELKNALDTITAPRDLFTFTQSADGSKWYLTENGLTVNGSQDEAAAILNAVSGQTFTTAAATTEVDDGFYIVKSSLGTALGLTTATQTLTIQEKNTVPTIKKTVSQDTASIGDTVTYTLTINVPTTAHKEIKVFDIMEEGLTYGNCTSGHTLNSSNFGSGDNPIVTLTEGQVKSAAGSEIVITYTATLNSNATLGENTNDNTAYITYSGQKSAESKAIVATYKYLFQKVAENANGDGLAGATFKLEKKIGEEWEIVKLALNGNTLCPSTNGSDTFTTTAEEMSIEGLGNGNYRLVETAAPAGYNMMSDAVTFEIENASKTEVAKLVNMSGTVLPTTGGMGTTVLYVVGALMVAGAVVLLVARRRVQQ